MSLVGAESKLPHERSSLPVDLQKYNPGLHNTCCISVDTLMADYIMEFQEHIH